MLVPIDVHARLKLAVTCDIECIDLGMRSVRGIARDSASETIESELLVMVDVLSQYHCIALRPPGLKSGATWRTASRLQRFQRRVISEPSQQ